MTGTIAPHARAHVSMGYTPADCAVPLSDAAAEVVADGGFETAPEAVAASEASGETKVVVTMAGGRAAAARRASPLDARLPVEAE